MLLRVWCLDPANSASLIAQLRPHGRTRDFEVAWVGEGWRSIVESCHAELVEAFPEYELLNIKQKWGVLAYQAFPRRWSAETRTWTEGELTTLHHITDRWTDRSQVVCEWCGGPGSLREWRTKLVLTLCDACDGTFSDPPQNGSFEHLRAQDA
jgi:hypothetical protein